MKNKQILSLLLAGCMAAAPVVPVYAATSAAESEEALMQESEEILDMQEAPVQESEEDLNMQEAPAEESEADEQDNTPVYKETDEAFFPEFLEKETLEDSVASLSSDPVQNFVSRLYSNILGRNADPNGLATWTEVLKSGKEQGAKVAQGFIESKEFQSRKMSDTEYIEILYDTFLGRDADTAGLKAWQNVLDSGLSRMHVFRGFAESPEFTQICQSYGILRGNAVLTEPRDQNENITKFVIRCYQLCLGRKADTDGLNAWCSVLLNGQNTAKEVAHGFLFSDEFLKKNLSNSAYVETLYHVFMDRNPDSAGWRAWIRAIENGQSWISVFNDFGDSDEFQKICASYGVQSGKGTFIGIEQTWQQAYAKKIQEYEQKYGVAEITNDTTAYPQPFMSGLSYMKLVNFKENSQPQLLLIYVDDWITYAEVWNYTGHDLTLLASKHAQKFNNLYIELPTIDGNTYFVSHQYPNRRTAKIISFDIYGYSGNDFKKIYEMIDYTRLDSANTINGKEVSDDDWNDMYEKWLEASHWSTFGEIYEGSWEEAVSQNQATKSLLGL